MNSRILLVLGGLFVTTALEACGSGAGVGVDGGGHPDGGNHPDGGARSLRLIAPLSTAKVTSRRPTLRWTLGAGDDGGHVQICRDRACSVEVISFDANGASGAPASDLPPGVSFWRVSARQAGATAPKPTATWEFTVGALSAPIDSSWGTTLDVNGDGYADAVVGPHLYLGGPSGLPTSPSSTLTGPTGFTFLFAGPAASAGDVNGDGYADFVVKDPDPNNSTDAAYVFLGSAAGLPTTPSLTLGGTSSGFFTGAVAGAGDVNGDGYADIVLGDSNNGAGSVYLYFGGAAGPSTTPDVTLTAPTGDLGSFGSSVAGAGDLNGDGYGDLLIGDFSRYPSSSGPATVVAYTALGTGGGPSEASLFALTSPEGAPSLSPSVASAGDVNGDGYADVLVGVSIEPAGGAFLYLGSASGPPAAPSLIFAGLDDFFGAQLAGTGDVDGDGYADILISDPGALPGQLQLGVVYNPGTAFLYRGGPNGPSTTPALALTNPDATAGTNPFDSQLFGGDVNGDGYSDLVAPVIGARQFGYLYLGSAGGLIATPVKLQ
jgi:FG-GAP-like repeat/FG-GAP repeat